MSMGEVCPELSSSSAALGWRWADPRSYTQAEAGITWYQDARCCARLCKARMARVPMLARRKRAYRTPSTERG